MNSQESLAKILSGVAKFQREVYPAQRELYGKLQHGQHPIAMFFTCADSRIVPNMLLQTQPGEVFIERTPGNIVPRYSDHVGGVTASMEYAAMVLRVPLIVVCGHTDCGVMKALLDPQQASGMPALQSWMRHSLPARERLLREHRDLAREDKLRLLTEYNVLTQLGNMKTHPAIEARLGKGELALEGWAYDIGAGSVRRANQDTGAFEMLDESGSR